MNYVRSASMAIADDIRRGKMEDRSKINDELLEEWLKTLEEEALRRLKLPKNQGKTAKEVLLELAMERLEKAEEKPKEEPVSEDAISGEEVLARAEADRKFYTEEELKKEAEMIKLFSKEYDADCVKVAFWNFDDRDAVDEDSMAEMLYRLF